MKRELEHTRGIQVGWTPSKRSGDVEMAERSFEEDTETLNKRAKKAAAKGAKTGAKTGAKKGAAGVKGAGGKPAVEPFHFTILTEDSTT